MKVFRNGDKSWFPWSCLAKKKDNLRNWMLWVSDKIVSMNRKVKMWASESCEKGRHKWFVLFFVKRKVEMWESESFEKGHRHGFYEYVT